MSNMLHGQSQEATDLAKALGIKLHDSIDSKDLALQGFTLRIYAGELAQITCEYLVESDTIEDAIKVIKKYELHEIEDKDNLHSGDS